MLKSFTEFVYLALRYNLFLLIIRQVTFQRFDGFAYNRKVLLLLLLVYKTTNE